MHIEFVWFVGVVENRLDPKKLGRCKVRIFGQHTEEKNSIPTDELPWAQPMHPITSSAMNGLGSTPVGPVEGTWVVGFYKDGLDCQEPVIMGSIGGIPDKYPDPESKMYGFLDPRTDLSARPRKVKKKSYPNDGTGAVLTNEIPTPPTGEKYPRTVHPFGCIVKEVDTNRLARNEKIDDSIVQIKKDTRDKEIEAADGTTWDEPETPFDPSYPYNQVEESESGHIVEVDDTVGGERLHTYHRSGTFEEIYPDGVKVEKVVGNNYKISLEEKYEHIQNRYNLTIDGPFNILVQNDANIIVKGDVKMEVGGDYDCKVGGDYKLEVKGKVSVSSLLNDVSLKSNKNTLIGAGFKVQLKATVITTNPPVEQALQSLVANFASPFIPNPPAPQIVVFLPPSGDTLTRDYPRVNGPYVSTKETL